MRRAFASAAPCAVFRRAIVQRELPTATAPLRGRPPPRPSPANGAGEGEFARHRGLFCHARAETRPSRVARCLPEGLPRRPPPLTAPSWPEGSCPPMRRRPGAAARTSARPTSNLPQQFWGRWASNASPVGALPSPLRAPPSSDSPHPAVLPSPRVVCAGRGRGRGPREARRRCRSPSPTQFVGEGRGGGRPALAPSHPNSPRPTSTPPGSAPPAGRARRRGAARRPAPRSPPPRAAPSG